MSVVLRKSQSVALAPTDMSKQGLLDALVQCSKGNFDELGRPFDYHFMAICISELSNFMPQYDPALAGLLTDLFDCPPMNDEKKRSGAGKSIPFPGISFVMGSATANLGNTIPAEMWGSGFMARVILVFSAEEVIPANMFAEGVHDEALEDQLAAALRRIGQLKGRMDWEPDAQAALRDFRINQKVGAPLHNRLTFYVTRRWLHLGKLCMIAALADERMVVRLEDFTTARGWLLDAESTMPEIFKDMVSHEDGQVHEEIRNLVWHNATRFRRGTTAEEIFKFLSQRVSSYAIPRIFEIAEKSGFIQREAGTHGDDAIYHPGTNTGPNPGVM